jgi:hypothetical protein
MIPRCGGKWFQCKFLARITGVRYAVRRKDNGLAVPAADHLVSGGKRRALPPQWQ